MRFKISLIIRTIITIWHSQCFSSPLPLPNQWTNRIKAQMSDVAALSGYKVLIKLALSFRSAIWRRLAQLLN
jgi:hypothetical protein